MLFYSCSQNNRCRAHPEEAIVNEKIEQQWNNIVLAPAWVGAGQKLSSAYHSLRAGTSGVHASTPLCMRACASCWLACRRTCVHKGCADTHAEEHACTSLVRTCTPENMRARALCGHARRRTRVHEACANMHAEEHACTRLVRTCTPG